MTASLPPLVGGLNATVLVLLSMLPQPGQQLVLTPSFSGTGLSFYPPQLTFNGASPSSQSLTVHAAAAVSDTPSATISYAASGSFAWAYAAPGSTGLSLLSRGELDCAVPSLLASCETPLLFCLRKP